MDIQSIIIAPTRLNEFISKICHSKKILFLVFNKVMAVSILVIDRVIRAIIDTKCSLICQIIT